MSEATQTSPEATTSWLARVHVTLKPVVLDPQGDAVLDALHHLGFARVSAVRVGKYFEVSLAARDQADAEQAVIQMCARLLANPVIESYRCAIEPQVAAPS
jgi:phosphoribosylformylglycinamidine synthase PurS subunit